MCYRFDAVTQLINGSTYAFVDRQFWRLTNDGAEEGFPQSIQSVWGIPGTIDAALTIRERTDIFQVSRNIKKKQYTRWPKTQSTVGL